MLGIQQVVSAENGGTVSMPTMTFSRTEGSPITTPHDDPLVVELKVATTLVHRILHDIGNSADIITRKCLQKLKCLGKDIIPPRLPHPGIWRTYG